MDRLFRQQKLLGFLLIKRLRCVIYLDDRIPEEADILDFFNLGGARRLRSEAFRRLLLSGWLAANKTRAMSQEPAAPSTPAVGAANGSSSNVSVSLSAERRAAKPESSSEDEQKSAMPTFNGNANGLSSIKETSNHGDKAEPPQEDFFGRLF